MHAVDTLCRPSDWQIVYYVVVVRMTIFFSAAPFFLQTVNVGEMTILWLQKKI